MLWQRNSKATIAFNMLPRRGPWGGGNQWLTQMIAFLRWQGYRVVFRLGADVDCVLYTHAGLTGDLAFRSEEIVRHKERYPDLKVIHRINDNDIRKGSGAMDGILARTDEISDWTVFVSGWLRDYHAARWLKPVRRHSVVQPGADPRIFHPIENHPPGDGPWRIVTHHWSTNLAKGFERYAEIDRCIAEGKLKDCELWIVGRWPSEIVWRSAKTFPSCSGKRLGDLLRRCHLYVSASQHEPGAMHVVEGLQSGLPLVYTADSGGTVEMGERFGVLMEEDVVGAIQTAQSRYNELRKRLIASGPSGDEMCVQYSRLIQQLLCERV